jgi:plasmid rolling circle replication initiator protein Rep
VSASYFAGRSYVKQAKWQELWKEAGRLDYDPSVDVRVVKAKKGQTIGDASAEVAKYAVKPEAYLKGTKAERDKVVRVLDGALRGRRLKAYGGLLRDIWQELKQRGVVEDEEEADLLKVGDTPENCQCSVCQSDMLEHLYRWSREEEEYLG